MPITSIESNEDLKKSKFIKMERGVNLAIYFPLKVNHLPCEQAWLLNVLHQSIKLQVVSNMWKEVISPGLMGSMLRKMNDCNLLHNQRVKMKNLYPFW